MTTVNAQTVNRAIFKAVKSLGLIGKKWEAEYFSDCGWVSLYSVKSGMEIIFPVVISITDSGGVELRSSEGDWAFFRHLPDEGDWMSEEMTETLALVFEYELTRYISRYWARK